MEELGSYVTEEEQTMAKEMEKMNGRNRKGKRGVEELSS